MNIYSPVKGSLKAIEEVNDEVFSLKMMGDGIAVVPEDGRVVAPITGKVSAVFPTGHAVGLEVEGVELLLHLGLDTVELNGKFFTSHVTQGQTVHAGELLIEMDVAGIKRAGYETDAILVVTNPAGKQVEKPAVTGEVDVEDLILTIK